MAELEPDPQFQQDFDEIWAEWLKTLSALKRSSDVFTEAESAKRFEEALSAAFEDVGQALCGAFFRGLQVRVLTWRERLRPRWRIFQWLHDAWYGEATFLCGERMNLHRGAGVEDWVAGLFEREME